MTAATSTFSSMDMPRKRRSRRGVVGAVAGVVVAALAVTFGLSRLGTAVPTVQRATLWVDTVKRGPLLREVRGLGTLVPEQIRFVSAAWAARVERIDVKVGEVVEADTVLLTLANPELELQALEADRQQAAAAATVVELETKRDEQRLAADAAIATLRFELAEARRTAAASATLGEQGLISAHEVQREAGKHEELETRLKLEGERKRVLATGLEHQLRAQREQLERLRAVSAFRHRQVESLQVRAGERGVVQELSLQPGQWVTTGMLLAKVAQPEKLKAEVHIAEAQARDVQVGQRVRVDTRTSVIAGTVARVDPAVQAGSVKIDVLLEGALPKGARPDLSVEGTVELERLDDALFIGRPAFAQPEGTASLFKVDGAFASRLVVAFGKASTTAVQVTHGLAEGDTVILSDMSQFESNERVALQ